MLVNDGMKTLFLTASELSELTGRKRHQHQIAWLRLSGIPFRVNAAGRPVVCRSAVEGTPGPISTPGQDWQPRVLRG
jgi:hypothetical protein